MRRAARVDRNQPDIVAALRRVGAFVQPLHTVGAGVPDLLVIFGGKVYLVEVKDGSKPPSARKLTPDQVDWHARCGTRVHVVENEAQALAVIGIAPAKYGCGGCASGSLEHEERCECKCHLRNRKGDE